MTKEELQAKLSALPDLPGSYQMKDKNGTIIYVGKAKNLKNRVRQYFTGAHDYKTTKMVSNIADFDWIVANSEKEALVLEINLIKQYTPRFNISFMDDKMYPYIKLTNDEYPVLKYVRDRKKDRKATYFGPYPDVTSARNTITLLNQIYPLRKCRVMPKKVCLYYHLGQCLGPCANEVNKEEYKQLCTKIVKVLKGDTKDLIKELVEQRNQHAENLEFEKAAEDQKLIESIQNTITAQQMQTNDRSEYDVWNIYEDKGYLCISTLLVRDGKVAKKLCNLQPVYEETEEAILSYIAQFYEVQPLPKEILVPLEWNTDVLDNRISETVFKPQRGHKMALLKLAYENANEYHNRHFTVTNKLNDSGFKAQDDFRELIGKPVDRIELFDNSHTGGENAVAGMVVYQNGKPDRGSYRKYKVHNGGDDLANMKEVIYRRYLRVMMDDLKKPDLILVDGGALQINAAREVLDSLYLDIPVYGLVKDDKHNTADLMDSKDNHLSIDKNSPLFFLLTQMQDEVHRFAITYHRSKRVKAQNHSALLDVKGIGEARRKKLLKHFGSISKLKEATLPQLEAIVPKDVARDLYDHLKENG